MESKIQFTDSHCHLDKLDLTPFNSSYDNLLSEAEKLGVYRFLCIGIDLQNIDKVFALANKYPNIYASVGSHPCNENTPINNPSVEKLFELAKDSKVIAIGETGIDYFHQDKQEVDYQIERFLNHIEVAKKTNKPLIIHMRNATNHQKASNDLLHLLKTYGNYQVKGVMHCFAEDIPVAKRALDLNFYISFSGIVSFKNAHTLKEVAKFVPNNRYLIETDSPWLAPTPFRGKENYPHYVFYVAKAMSELRNVSLETISQETENNFNQLFLKA